MSEEQTRLDNAMSEMFEELDKSYFREIQVKSLKCAITCYEDRYSSTHNIQNCIENCNRPLQNAKSLVDNEINYMQNRLQGCVLSCDNKSRDKFGKDSTKYKGEFESCAKECIDSHINDLPSTLKRIKEMLKKELQ